VGKLCVGKTGPHCAASARLRIKIFEEMMRNDLFEKCFTSPYNIIFFSNGEGLGSEIYKTFFTLTAK
jgi:hypothetical protein